MTWLLVLVLLVAAAATGEVHGRHVAYARRQAALRGLVAQMEDLAGRWSARRVAAEVLRQARMPRRRAVLGPDVALDDIPELPSDVEFRPERCAHGCEDCAEIADELAATAGPADSIAGTTW